MYGIDRVVLIVLDSVGVGALPDAARFGDEGSDTLGNTARAVGGVRLPHFRELGLGNIHPVPGVSPVTAPRGAFGRMAESSAAKDTTIGHWELAGVVSPVAFPTFPRGFPSELISDYEQRIGRRTLGNYPASGTVILEELGAKHMRTGYPIVYTSGDSVFQVAAHEEIIPVDELYRMCVLARQMLTAQYAVGRVIARPFVGRPGAFQRTECRRDFALPPPEPTVLDYIVEDGQTVHAIGKIEDIFAGRGISEAVHTHDNMHGVDETLKAMRKVQRGLVFTNLVDFDMRFGHRNNPEGYAQALEEVDSRVADLRSCLREGDALVFTADHGCDPTTASTDHSREYVPLLVVGEHIQEGTDLGTRPTFADLGATVADWLQVTAPAAGQSFAANLAPIHSCP